MDRRFPRFARGKGSLQRTVVAAAAAVLALAALGFLIWALVTGSAIRLAWLVAMATILAAVLPAWAMSAQMLAWVRRRASDLPDPGPRPSWPGSVRSGHIPWCG
jgi:Flp pilus assembly protein TadB